MKLQKKNIAAHKRRKINHIIITKFIFLCNKFVSIVPLRILWLEYKFLFQFKYYIIQLYAYLPQFKHGL
jgi:hypothetical protein